ncbi:VOC family protein [Paenibacillus sp. FSL H8-0537]|uniref:VOC family protein n=1 Tax=Paenibacillus sp. FSL H8-0537 TaxID=2921399 RepID=UPI003101B06F
MSKKQWAGAMPAVQFRVARPTNQLAEVAAFYEQGLGLLRIGSFEGHDGYDGLMFGLPGADYHLEFTQHVSGAPLARPSEDNLLVFYIDDREQQLIIAKRLLELGYPEVEPENPYWKQKAITIADPDGYRIVLQNTSGLS